MLPGLLLKLWSSPAASEKTRYLPYFPVSQSGTGKTAQQLLAWPNWDDARTNPQSARGSAANSAQSLSPSTRRPARIGSLNFGEVSVFLPFVRTTEPHHIWQKARGDNKCRGGKCFSNGQKCIFPPDITKLLNKILQPCLHVVVKRIHFQKGKFQRFI